MLTGELGADWAAVTSGRPDPLAVGVAAAVAAPRGSETPFSTNAVGTWDAIVETRRDGGSERCGLFCAGVLAGSGSPDGADVRSPPSVGFAAGAIGFGEPSEV